jgi:hypothetical protein
MPALFISLCVLTTILFLVVRIRVGGVWGVITKTLASFLFVTTALVGLVLNAPTVSSLFVVLGLLCGLIGDIVLDLKVVYKEDNDKWLNTGMFSFGLGHIFYFIALFTFVVNDCGYLASNTPLYIPILIGVGVALLLSCGTLVATKMMKLDFGKFFYQSAGYTMLLTSLSAISVVLAVFYNVNLLIFGMGAVAIFVSDLILSLNYFGGQADNKLLIVLNHAIYYLGQILIAAFLLFV